MRYGVPRRSPHLLWTAPVVIKADGERHVGLVRDVSAEGLGVFSDFVPKTGCVLELTIRVPRTSATVTCTGKVVRSDSTGAGGAVVIGIRLSDYTVSGDGCSEGQYASIAEALQKLCSGSDQEKS